MRPRASAVASTTLLLAVGFLSALAAKSVAQSVAAQRVALARATPAALDASPMSECASCKDERVRGERYELPPEATATGFRHPSLPTYACSHCDGEVVPSAMRKHAAREDA